MRTDFKKWLEDNDLPVARAAEIFEVDRKTVDRWLTVEGALPLAIWTECRILAGVTKLYQLRPKPEHAQSVHWRASSHNGLVTVRAPNRRMARQFAALRFGRSARRGSDGEEAPRNPWMANRLVEAVTIPGSKAMPSEGPLGIIDPPGLL